MIYSGICHLIKNCPKLKTIKANDEQIIETTIEAFIEKALNNPKTYHKFISSNILSRKRVINNTIF
jgi:hypothetical protein